MLGAIRRNADELEAGDDGLSFAPEDEALGPARKQQRRIGLEARVSASEQKGEERKKNDEREFDDVTAQTTHSTELPGCPLRECFVHGARC